MNMSSTKIEFAVQMTCQSCVDAVNKSLQGVDGIKNVEVDLTTGSVVVDTSLPADAVLQTLLGCGRKAVIKGYGTFAAVAVMDTGSRGVHGVVRFIQQDPNTCVIDGTIDGLEPGEHVLGIHECGDISNGCESVGDFFNPMGTKSERLYGNLGFIKVSENGRSAFKFDDKLIKLSEIIGRSLVISDGSKRLSCGIIARSAGLFQNPKMICACDGVSIWNEKIGSGDANSRL